MLFRSSYCRLNLLRASEFHFERLDILRDSIRHPSKKLLSFEFDKSFRFQFGASLDILRDSAGIRLKSFSRLNFLRASVFNLERLDILRDSIGHLSKKLLSFEFAQSFGIPFRASRYITGLNQTSE